MAICAPFAHHSESSSDDPFPDVDGRSPAIRALKRDMRAVAGDRDATVLILGESGTGKERVARAIHRASERSSAPFVAIDCAGLSPTLAEDTLFGHVRGAFTGAIDERAGPFERAQGGTVLLDEIGDLPLDLQMKLLRALQARTILRLGARHETPFDARIVAATNVDLAAAVARGRFREDLFYRLNVFALTVAPLRRRGAGDIGLLASAIVAELARRRRRPAPTIDAAALARLTTYAWPGNVRELENALERMIVAAAGEPCLQVRHLPDSLRRPAIPAATAALPGGERIRDALARHGFHYGRAAAELALSRHQLYRLVRRYGIRRG